MRSWPIVCGKFGAKVGLKSRTTLMGLLASVGFPTFAFEVLRTSESGHEPEMRASGTDDNGRPCREFQIVGAIAA